MLMIFAMDPPRSLICTVRNLGAILRVNRLVLLAILLLLLSALVRMTVIITLCAQTLTVHLPVLAALATLVRVLCASMSTSVVWVWPIAVHTHLAPIRQVRSHAPVIQDTLEMGSLAPPSTSVLWA
jgi:hypothetical protein